MEWNQLQRFLVVAREENFSKAASLLYTSQPSLSQMIKRLEKELGYPLFDREGKRIKLNESGRIFMNTILQMEQLMENTKVQLEELNHIPHPKVSIRVASASPLLPELLLYLKKHSPSIQYQIKQWKGETEEEEADIRIMSGSVVHDTPQCNAQDSDLQNYLLLVENVQLALPRNHPLQEKSNITLQDLADEEFICLNERWELGRGVTKELNRLLFNPKVTMLVDNPNMMRELLKAHLGIAFVPSVTWHSFAGEDILLRPVEGFQLSRCIYMQTKAVKYLTKEQKECMEGIISFFTLP